MTIPARGIAAVLAGLAAASTAPAVALPGSSAAAAASGVSAPALLSSIAPWAYGVPAGVQPLSQRVDIAMQLRTRHASVLHHRALAVSTPGSASYRHFLTRKSYVARYAPTAASATAVRSWLRAHGLHVDSTSPNRSAVAAHGSAGAVASAFHLSFAKFRVGSDLLRAPLTEPTLPASMRQIVRGVAGLSEIRFRPAADPAPAFFNARPCSAYYGQKTPANQPKYAGKRRPAVICGYTPSQVRAAYGVNKTHATGKGATVAIVDAYASPTELKDANTYSKKHGLPTFKSGQYTEDTNGAASAPPEPGVVDPQGWAGEETLDVEAVHSMAPGANIYYVAATSNIGPGLEMALQRAVESGKAQIVSNSWGSAFDAPDPASQSIVDSSTDEAAATGVTINFSSGDDGDETDPSADGERMADFPATSPGVTAVGGTSIEIGKKGKRLGETYWGTFLDNKSSDGKSWDLSTKALAGAGGGGVSSIYDEPAWQKGIVPKKLTTIGRDTPGRVLPDVSMLADSSTGFLVGQTQQPKSGPAAYSEYRIGGTSVSCPLLAGIFALAVQKHGKGLGLVTPTLYGHSKQASARKALFRDPSGVKVSGGQSLLANVRPDYSDSTDKSSSVTFALRTLGNLETLHRYVGYDDSTGLGSPKAPAIVALLGKKK